MEAVEVKEEETREEGEGLRGQDGGRLRAQTLQRAADSREKVSVPSRQGRAHPRAPPWPRGLRTPGLAGKQGDQEHDVICFLPPAEPCPPRQGRASPAIGATFCSRDAFTLTVDGLKVKVG